MSTARTVRCVLALILASTPTLPSFAQPAPGAHDSPGEHRDPAQPRAPSPPPDTTTPATTSPPPTDDLPPIPVVPQPPPSPPPPAPPKPRVPPSQLDGSTRLEFAHERHFDLHWELLMLPATALELALLPVGLLVGAIDRHRLDRRIGDLLSVENLKVKLSPRFKFSFGDGAGAGLWVKREQVFDWRASVRAGGIVRLDRDWQLELEYDHALLLPGGRGLRARSYVERDKNQRYFGIGATSTYEDKRVLQSFDQGALVELDLQGIDHYTTSGVAQLGLRRQQLSAGVDPTYAPVMATGDVVAPPPGFDQAATYVDARLVGRYDTRDTLGRPSRGWFLESSVLGRADVTGKHLSATTLSAAARYHLAVLPGHRVLVLMLGGAAALPLFPGDDKPLDSLATIDRTNVRGYDRERFRDRYAVVASAEYRFPVYEYLTSKVGLDGVVFVDAGAIWGEDKLALPVRRSYGFGLRGASETNLYLQTTLSWSPEGAQFNVGVEKML